VWQTKCRWLLDRPVKPGDDNYGKRILETGHWSPAVMPWSVRL
jgi:hypothetical protein